MTLPLSLPRSDLQQYEAKMPYPNLELATNRGFSMHSMQCYAAQLYLRKQLAFVGNPLKSTRYTNREDAITELQETLKDSRHKWVPQSLQWKDGDPPPKDALSARLRAKYWDLQVLLYLPFLNVVLEGGDIPLDLYRITSLGSLVDNTNNMSCATQTDRGISYVKLAIQALIQSTAAYHSLDRQALANFYFYLPTMAHTYVIILSLLLICSY